jgi:predicted RND superfamily exporter protein
MHVLTAFHERRLAGQDRREATHAALAETLPAVSYTTLVITLGFGILALSDFTFIRNFGTIIAGIMCVCWLADVHLLPALVARRWIPSRPTARAADPPG